MSGDRSPGREGGAVEVICGDCGLSMDGPPAASRVRWDRCPECRAKRDAKLRAAGIHVATRSMHRPDRVTVKPPTRWERFVLWLARRLP